MDRNHIENIKFITLHLLLNKFCETIDFEIMCTRKGIKKMIMKWTFRFFCCCLWIVEVTVVELLHKYNVDTKNNEKI